jgi:arsenate reductase-like glutaredoxin family protein
MNLYGIPNCNTAKKVCTWLEAHSVACEFNDYKNLKL